MSAERIYYVVIFQNAPRYRGMDRFLCPTGTTWNIDDAYTYHSIPDAMKMATLNADLQGDGMLPPQVAEVHESVARHFTVLPITPDKESDNGTRFPHPAHEASRSPDRPGN